MTATMHPDDLELFEYVEGDLDEARRPNVAAHVAACERCAEEVRLLEAGKQALREAPFLELPAGARDALLRGLPRQPRAERPSFRFARRRLLTALAPVAVVVAVVLVLTNTGGNGSERGAAPAPSALSEQMKSSSQASGAAEAAPQAQVPGDQGAPSVQAAAPPAQAPADQGAPSVQAAAPPQAPIRSVAGSAEDVAAFLRKRGFAARAAAWQVEVRGAAAAAVERALADRPAGNVAVVVTP